MQTSQVIKTIRWIDAQIPIRAKETIFTWNYLTGRPSDSGANWVESLISGTQDLAKASSKIFDNPDAVEVIKAFSIKSLFDMDYIASIISEIVSKPSEIAMHNLEVSNVESLYEKIRTYFQMIRTVEAWEKLTTPTELQSEKLEDDILSLNIETPPMELATVNTLTKSTSLLSDLYEAIGIIYDKKLDKPLAVVKIESGSGIRINFKGIGDPIKHLKDFLLEAWHKVRHKRPEEVIEKNNSLLSSLAVLDHINARVEQGGITKEEAETLRRRVMQDALGLFECRALIDEIPSQENVNNTNLLDGFSPKLLPAPKKAANKTTKKAVKKSPKKRAAKTAKKSAKKAPKRTRRKKML